MTTLFPGFSTRLVPGDGADIFVRAGGSGPGLLLIHGFPQTGANWHRIAPVLAERFTVVVPDLRGYGRSSRPDNDPGNLAYGKRAMAADLVAVMAQLGHERFGVCGHDRGGRVAYRLALDHAASLTRLVTLDIVPTAEQWPALGTATGAVETYHWPMLAQPAPLPETLIGHDPDFWFEWTLRSWTAGKSLDAFAATALDEYRTAWRQREIVHAMCNDYRAGATCDDVLDRADLAAGRRIGCPMLALWGEAGIPGKSAAGRPLDVWRRWADDVRGQPVNCGHFLSEEAPNETLAAMLAFLEQD